MKRKSRPIAGHHSGVESAATFLQESVRYVFRLDSLTLFENLSFLPFGHCAIMPARWWFPV